MGWAARARYRQLAGTMCEGCAYRHGTEANQDGAGDVMLSDLRKALLDIAQPFFCHDPRYRFEGSRVMCAGHMDAMKARYRNGFYERQSETERQRLTEHARRVCADRDAIWKQTQGAA